MEVVLAEHGIFRRQLAVLEWKDVGRNEGVRRGQPTLAVGRSIIGYDQVEIEHQPVELFLAQAASVEQHRPARFTMFRGDGLGHGRHSRIDWLGQFLPDEIAQ